MIIVYILSASTGVLGGLLYFSIKKLTETANLLKEQQKSFEKEKAVIRKDAQKRSGAVQWGKTIEHFVPL